MDNHSGLPSRIGRDLLVDILDSLYDGVYCINRNKEIIFWNSTAEDLSGYKASEVRGHPCSENILQHVDEYGSCLCINGCPLHATLVDGRKRSAFAFMHHKNGHRIPVTMSTSPLRNENGEIIGAIEVFSSSQILQSLATANQKLKDMAFIDVLTELPNRRFGEQKLEEAFFNYQRYGYNFAIAIFDIDDFKSFNDKYGHSTGDKILKVVSKTLMSGSRHSDFVCRWGGEEFLAIFTEVCERDIDMIANRQRLLVAASFIEVDGEKLSVTVSGGVETPDKHETLKDLLDAADQLLYKSKNSGKNSVTYSD